MKKICFICWIVLSVTLASPILPEGDSAGNETEEVPAKADSPYIPYHLINHTSTYDEEQVRIVSITDQYCGSRFMRSLIAFCSVYVIKIRKYQVSLHK
jgi:hypothetical protein